MKEIPNSFVTVNIYVSELINNDEGKFDSFESAWMTVPTEWAQNQITLQKFESLENFFNEYTYDDTDGWLHMAISEGVLLGCGIGLDLKLNAMADELKLEEIEYVAVEDVECCEIEIMPLASAKNKYISLRLADKDYTPTDAEKLIDCNALKNIDSKALGERLEWYGFLIR